ncbi:MAG: DUF2163 domain-containing protein [Alphaproteobacteria bacterium]|nr:DUF2163 domain-containing protein [Alphaproteobacteria bacterium]
MALSAEFKAHLGTGATSVCRCWAVTRMDGLVLGFTDHDVDLGFDGISFAADAGLSARALEQTTGLAVDNTEALGVLSSASVNEDDIVAGRYDGAEVVAWLVNWADVSQRLVLFRGQIGEIQRSAGAYQAELRGLSDALNQPQGRVYQKSCGAVLGDGACSFDLDTVGYSAAVPVEVVQGRKFFEFSGLAGFADRWFEKGQFRIESGAAAGLVGLVKNDRLNGTDRVVELWEAVRADVAVGDMVRIEAGCDRRVETCKLKFNNLLNFRGFISIPGEDWLLSVPRKSGVNDGGSLSS